MTKVNPSMLLLARHSRAMTQGDVATALGISQSKVAKFETGSLIPKEGELAELAKLFDEPVGLFALPDSQYGPGSSCTSYYRSRKALSATDLKRIVADVNLIRIRVARLMEGVQVENPCVLDRIDIDAMDGDAESIAAMVRTSWRLPPGPIPNLTVAAEQAGIVVMRCPFGTDKIDAMSQLVPGCPPVVCVNSAMSGERIRFSLAHEIGHLVMHAQGCGENAEREADRFAAGLLLPEEMIRDDLKPPTTLNTLMLLKPKWKVSVKALVMRSRTLGIIDDNQAKWLYIKMNRMGWSRQEPIPIEAERPRVVRELIDFRTKEQGLNLAEVSRIAEIKEQKLREVFLGETRRLRLA